jgi:hypothetical protein
MSAYFPSKFSKHLRAVVAVTLLLICMAGTHWIGFAHSISHGVVQQKTIDQASASDLSPTYSHSSDACHLFDALTLAGFIPGTSKDVSVTQHASINLIQPLAITVAQTALSSYQSRAPPTFIV